MSGTLLYGLPGADLVAIPDGAVQAHPRIVGAVRLDELAGQGFDRLIMLAPAHTVERFAVIAMGLASLKVGGDFTILAAKNRGGARLAKELGVLGVACFDQPKRHHRICTGVWAGNPETLAPAIAAGQPACIEAHGLVSQPGLFSYDRLDPGTSLLIANLPMLSGRGADLGCGYGALSAHVVAGCSDRLVGLTGIDLDRRATDLAARNIPQAVFSARQADIASTGIAASSLDFVVSNPPFHVEGREDRALGVAFIAEAARILRKGGRLYLVANRHLPYEAMLDARFARWSMLADANGYKVIEAVR